MSDPLEFRCARSTDLERIVALLADDDLGATREVTAEGPGDAYRAAFARIEQSPDTDLFVVEHAGEVIGVLQLSFLPGLTYEGGTRAEIEGVRVAAAARGSGVGGRLVRHAIDEARRRGCRLVQLTTDQRRPEAQRFYERLGFTPSHVGFKLDLGRGA